MRAHFKIPIKPFSVNMMYYGEGRHKTSAAREWSYKVFHYLDQEHIKEQLETLHQNFDPKTEGFIVHLKAVYPKSRMFTQEGVLSARIHDLSNWEKPLIDLLFLPKHRKKKSPYGCQNIGYDDKFIVSCSSRKAWHEDETHEIQISISIVKINIET